MLIELLVMLAIALGGTALAFLLGARNKWLVLPFGLTALICLRMVSYSLTVVAGLRSYATWAFFGLVIAAVVWAAVKYRAQLLVAAAVSSTAGALAWVLGRVLAIKPMSHSDSTWILVMSSVFADGKDPALLNEKVPFKRGFDYPLMLALGPKGEYLSALTPYIALALASAVIWAVSALLQKQNAKTALWLGVGLALVVFTTTMPLRAVFYINGHTLTALGVILLAVTTVLVIRKQELQSADLAVLVVAVALTTTARPEGILISFMSLLPLLASRFIKRWQLCLLASTATVSLATWLLIYNSYILNALKVSPWFMALALVAIGLVPWIKWFDGLRFRLLPIALISMSILVLAVEAVFFSSMQKGDVALFSNLFLNTGDWGLLMAVIAIGLIAAGFKKRSADYKLLFKIAGTLALSFLIAKMLDGGQSGHPDLGRVGWVDSLNRMWIHLLPVLLVLFVVGLTEKLDSRKLKN